MSVQRRQDLLYPPGPSREPEEDEEQRHLPPPGLTPMQRLHARLWPLRGDEAAISAILRTLPPGQRQDARLVLSQLFGGLSFGGSERAAALCQRAWGPEPREAPQARPAQLSRPTERADGASIDPGPSGASVRVRSTVGTPEALRDFGTWLAGRTPARIAEVLAALLAQHADDLDYQAALLGCLDAAGKLLGVLDAAKGHPLVFAAAENAKRRGALGQSETLGPPGAEAAQPAPPQPADALAPHLVRVAAGVRRITRAAQSVRQLGERGLALGTQASRRAFALLDEVSGGTATHGLVRLQRWMADAAPPAPRPAVMASAEADTRRPDEEYDTADIVARLERERASGEPLSPVVHARMRRLLGHDFSHVRIHLGRPASQATAALGARALSLGTHIFFADGQYAPGTFTGDRLLAHELTHVIQHDQGRLGASPHPRVSHPSDAAEVEARAVAERVIPGDGATARLSTDAPGAGPEVPADRTATGPSPRAPGASARAPEMGHQVMGGWPSIPNPANLLGDAAASVVRRISPGLADLIQQGPAGLLQQAIGPAISTWISGLGGGVDLGAQVAALRTSVASAFAVLQGARAGDARCCEILVDGVNALRELGQAFVNNPAIQGLRGALGRVSQVIGQISRVVLSPVFDVVKDIVGGVWSAVQTVASTIAGWVRAVRDAASSAFDWVAEQLGLPSGGEEGILSWLSGKASALWGELRQTLQPVLGPLQTVGSVLLALSPLGPLFLIVRYAPRVVQAVSWLWAHRNDPQIVRRAHEEMGHTILPQLLEAGQGFVGTLRTAAQGFLGELERLGAGLLELLGGLTGLPLLGAARSLVGLVSQAVQDAVGWVQGAFGDATEWASETFGKLANFLRPYKELLCSIGLAIASPPMIPMILAGWAWRWLPDCIKPPLVDLLLDIVIGAVEAAPALPMLGLLWPLLKPAIVGFLRGFRSQPPDVKITVTNKLAKILSGASPEFLLGFVKGLLQGLWEGLTDPFVLIWSAIEGLGQLVSWLGSLGQQATEGTRVPASTAAQPPASAAGGVTTDEATGTAPAGLPSRAELGVRAGQMMSELQPPVEQVTTGFRPAVEALFQGGGQGLTLDGLIARLRGVWSAIEQTIRGAAAGLAARICQFFMGEQAEGQLGETVGWLVGTIAFEVVLGILTAGAWQPVSAAGRALKAFARILDWTGEALGAAFRLLGRIGGLLLDALRGLRRMLDSAGGAVRRVLDALADIGHKLMSYANEVLGRFGRGVADEATERAGRETAEAATERAGRETVEAAGERTGRETTEAAGERAGQEGAEEVGEQGGKRTDDAPDLSEKLRVAAEAKVMSDTLEAAHTPVNAIVSALSRTFMPRHRWIQRFEAEPRGPLVWDVYMIASKIKVDEVRADARQAREELLDPSGDPSGVERYDPHTIRATLEQRYPGALTSTTIPPLNAKNVGLAGGRHPISGTAPLPNHRARSISKRQPRNYGWPSNEDRFLEAGLLRSSSRPSWLGRRRFRDSPGTITRM